MKAIASSIVIALAVTIIFRINGYFDTHGLYPKEWEMIGLVVSFVTVLFLGITLVIVVATAMRRNWHLSLFCLLMLGILVPLNAYPVFWISLLDKARLCCFAGREKDLLKSVRASRPEFKSIPLFSAWGDWGFAGGNMFSFLIHSNDPGAIKGLGNSSAFKGAYVLDEATVNPSFEIKRRCIVSLSSLGGEYFVLRAAC